MACDESVKKMTGSLQTNLQRSCVASGTDDEATKRLCILYEVTDCLLQHAGKLSCYFVLGTEGEQLSVLASDQMAIFFSLQKLCSLLVLLVKLKSVTSK